MRMFNKNDQVLIKKNLMYIGNPYNERYLNQSLSVVKSATDTLFTMSDNIDLNNSISGVNSALVYKQSSGISLYSNDEVLNISEDKTAAIKMIDDMTNVMLDHDNIAVKSKVENLQKEIDKLNKQIVLLEKNGIKKDLINTHRERLVNRIK